MSDTGLWMMGLCLLAMTIEAKPLRPFNAETDLLSLHYDHAPDKDDGHSAAADRMILQSEYGAPWLKAHVLAVSGAYGLNWKTFNPASDAVMDATWNGHGGWIVGHANRSNAVAAVLARWIATLEAGGDVYVKEGGQSDITAACVARIRAEHPGIETRRRIHVVQHSTWNEKQTTPEALTYTRAQTDYIRIKDANRFLNTKGGDAAFEAAAREHPVFGEAWRAAFAYYPPKHRLDFSDTGELMHILGLGKLHFDALRERYLEN